VRPRVVAALATRGLPGRSLRLRRAAGHL